MKKIIAMACLSVSVMVAAPAFAGAQQEKMKGCNIEAKGMKGAERKTYMSMCLKKDYTLKAETTAAIGQSAAPAAPVAPVAVAKPAAPAAVAKPTAPVAVAKPAAPAAVVAPVAAAKPTASAAAPIAAATSAAPTQQNRMKSCNADAKTQALKGADRKTFMSSCLKS
jgi:psiF repeat